MAAPKAAVRTVCNWYITSPPRLISSVLHTISWIHRSKMVKQQHSTAAFDSCYGNGQQQIELLVYSASAQVLNKTPKKAKKNEKWCYNLPFLDS